jgi:hypothetical protein
MRVSLKLVSWLGLTLTLLPSFFVFGGALSPEAFKGLVLAGSALWLTTAPFWINDEPGGEG